MSLTVFYIVCRWLHFGALISLAGAGFYTTLLTPKRYRPRLTLRLQPLLTVSCWLTLISALLLLAVQTGLMGDGWRDILHIEIWDAVLHTGFGRAWQWQCGLALCACLVLVLKGRIRQQCLWVLALLQLVGLAFVGHAAILEGGMGILQRGNQIIHLLAAAFWVGGLYPVVLLMRESHDMTWRYDAIRTMMRFSRYGHLAVALVLLSGLCSSLLLLGWPLHSFRLYSQLLLVKILLVSAMVGIAVFNRYWLVPRFRESGSHSRQHFVTTTLVEIVLSALALIAVSVFATMEPA